MSDSYKCGDYESGEDRKVSNLPHHNKIENKAEGGTKHDQDKPPMELLARSWLEGVAIILGFGAKKYGRWNWARGLEQSRLIGAALRHIHAFNAGEDNDAESGMSHLYHASCCLMFAAEMLHTRPDLDDRYKGEKT